MSNENLILPEHGPSRSDAVQNRELLLTTARNLFAQHNVDNVSMSSIAQAAGVGKGTLYRHFASKTDVCYALLDEAQKELQERTLARLSAVQDPVGNLRWFLSEVLDFVELHSDLLTAASEESGRTALNHPAHYWWRLTIFRLLEQVGISGDISYIADTLYVMLDVRTLHFQQQALGYSTERSLDGLMDLLTALTT